MGFSAAQLKTGGAPVVEGTNTGLTPNSIVLSISISTQSFYVAVWQNKAFMVILAILNIDSAASTKAALAENGRIKEAREAGPARISRPLANARHGPHRPRRPRAGLAPPHTAPGLAPGAAG